MRKYLYLILLIISSIVSISCSDTNENKRDTIILSKSEKEIYKDIEIASLKKIVSIENSNKAKTNLKKYAKKGFFGKNWPIPIITIVFLLFTLYAYGVYEEAKQAEMKRPLRKADFYLLFIFTGVFGIPFLRLKKLQWVAWTTIFTCFFAIIVNYKILWTFYNVPEILFISSTSLHELKSLTIFYYSEIIVGGLIAFNIVWGIIVLPYYIYRYNSLYFRKHHENNAILSGKELEVDWFYNKELLPHIHQLENDLELINKYCSDDNYIMEDPEDDKLDGFFKGIFTFGASGKLKHAVGRLRLLSLSCQGLSKHLDELNTEYFHLSNYLQKYRIAAYRNLYLAKELIKVIKDNMSSQQQELLTDNLLLIDTPKYSQTRNVTLDASSVSFNNDSFTRDFSVNINDALENMSNYIEEIKNPTHNDVIDAAIVNGVQVLANTAISAITGLFDMNSRTREALKNTEVQISNCIQYLSSSIPKIQQYQATLLRQSEIMIALSNFNKAFVHEYEPLRHIVFGRPNIKQFLHGVVKNREIFKTDDFRKNLQLIITTCSEYNKINKATVSNNSKMEHSTELRKKSSAQTMNTPTEINKDLSYHLIEETTIKIIKQISGREFIADSFLIENIGINPPYLLRRIAEELNRKLRINISIDDLSNCTTVKEIIYSVSLQMTK